VKITVGMSDSERVECDLQPCMMSRQDFASSMV
jgi:hypothetical protein